MGIEGTDNSIDPIIVHVGMMIKVLIKSLMILFFFIYSEKTLI